MYRILFIFILFAVSCNQTKNNHSIDPSASPIEQSVYRGKSIYDKKCVSCHMSNGKGIPNTFPPVHHSNWLTNKRIASIHAIKYGLKGKIEVNGLPYDNVMLAQGLNDQQVADVMNYMIQEWNKGDIITIEEVKAVQE